MNSQTNKKTSEVFSQYTPWFFFAAAFQSLFPIAKLLLIPSESGISIARLALLGVLGFFLFVGIYLGFIARKNLSAFDKFASTTTILFSALLSLTSGWSLFLLRYLNPEQLLPYYERLSPLLWYLFVISLQAILFFLLVKNGFHPQELSKRKQTFAYSIFAFCLLLSVFLFVAITKIGITPDTAYWGEPGVPIQLWHFVIAVLIGLTIFLLSSFLLSRLNYASRITNYLFPITIYLTACILWVSVPLETLATSFYAPASPPLNIPLPYSDAGYYDFASQSLLIGTGYFGNIPPRPLYVTFLAFLHLLFDQDYATIMNAQSCVIALFPVALYFLGKKLHSPAAGVAVALFAIFREYTSLLIASNTRVANSKIFITDLPTAMSIAIMCLVVIWWLENRTFRNTLIAGGAFGLMLLFRTQSTITLPILFLLVLFVLQFKWAEWIKTGIVFAIAMFFSVIPWLTHNYTISGQFSFDDPKQVAIIYSQYSFSGNLDISQFNPETDSVGKRILEFTLENPAFVANFVTSHFLNTEIGGLLALPLIKPFNGLQEPVNLYWMEWDGSLEWYNLILILFYLIILAIGFGAAWKKMSWLGLIPLAFNLGYALSNGIARFSSWRYNLPVDWVVYFYFAIGLAELFFIIASLFGKNNMESINLLIDKHKINIREFRPQYIFIIFAFTFIGSTPWLTKGIAEPRYTASQNELIAELESNEYNKAEIESFLIQPNALLIEGRMLYPRFYRRTEGLSSTNPWPAYATQDFSRIGFVLINNRNYDVIYPTREILNFAQGADVIVLACQVDNFYIARLVRFENQTFKSDPLLAPCN
ncbi:MAG: glycosyltransferase family 39 protein [Anaerolineales bacterium]|nr:glycosyltransferase family 39 protein [Anaerolineales bacterium]